MRPSILIAVEQVKLEEQQRVLAGCDNGPDSRFTRSACQIVDSNPLVPHSWPCGPLWILTDLTIIWSIAATVLYGTRVDDTGSCSMVILRDAASGLATSRHSLHPVNGMFARRPMAPAGSTNSSLMGSGRRRFTTDVPPRSA